MALITKSQWIKTIEKLASDMKAKGTVYRWKSPVNEANSMKSATCVSFVSLALQRAGYLPSGKYINFQDTGNIHGNGASYVKQHTEMFTLIENVNKSPQSAGLQVGDIVAYKAHIMIFAGWSGKTPLWYSLERSSGGIGKKPRIDVKGVFKYYNTRKIDGGIIRLKFKAETTKPTTTTNTSTSASKPVTSQNTVKWKLKASMNMRNAVSGSKVICKVPKGTVLTQKKKKGYWIYTTYNGHTGWVCCATDKYATKV